MNLRTNSSRDSAWVVGSLDANPAQTAMPLQPRRPPGHGKRKALCHTADILRLRAEGYSLSAIREALEDAGVLVSISTVRREVLKGMSAGPALQPTPTPAPPPPSLPLARREPRRTQSKPPEVATGTPSLPGKGVAEAYMQGRTTNALFLEESER
jgi:hypothetical protein